MLVTFNIGACSKSRLLQILSEYVQLVEIPTHIAGSTLEYVYVRKTFLEDYEVKIVIITHIFLIATLQELRFQRKTLIL